MEAGVPRVVGEAKDEMSQSNPKKFFSQTENEAIIAAIRLAESGTSGEIRVHLVSKLSGDGLEEGAKIFEKLGMTATRERNGILFVLGVHDHKLVLLGDLGIHQRVPANFWAEVKESVLAKFREGFFVEGLQRGITLCGERLKEYFPVQGPNQNELRDEISHSSD